MKILVAIKRVPDYQAKIRVKSDGSGIETDGLKWGLNPFDEIAVEEAIRLKEGGKAQEIVVTAIGEAEVEAQLRYALALGADRAILVSSSAAVDSDFASRAIAAVFQREQASLLLMGKQAIDSDAGQTPSLCAVRLNLPLASFASKVVIDNGTALVTREVDGGLETVRVRLPCVISTDLRLNEPRYATLPGQMKAKKKPLDMIAASDLGLGTYSPGLKIRKLKAPPKRSGGKKVESVDALLTALRVEAKVI